jgi:hypothetical protein
MVQKVEVDLWVANDYIMTKHNDNLAVYNRYNRSILVQQLSQEAQDRDQDLPTTQSTLSDSYSRPPTSCTLLLTTPHLG